MSEKIPGSIRVLLAELIDYAGLFPPAALSMPEAVINYATYCNSNYNWMLGRFVVHINRLAEFTESAKDFYSRDDGKRCWQLSVLASEDIEETVRKIEEFNAAQAPFAVADTLEVKTNTNSLIEQIVEAIPPELTTYFELPLSEKLPDLVATLALHKQRAKIRTGGVTVNDFPTSDQIARFMRLCLAANVPFKATAGLHHPIRCDKPLTYEKNAPIGTMHGFLNLFLAAGFTRQGYKSSLIHELLQDEMPESFTFDETGVLWRQEYFLSTAQLKDLREKHALSFGSCSFVEPISDLQEIELL